MNSIHATQVAEELICQWGILKLPIDPFKIAADHDILVMPMPSSNGGVSGMLISAEGQFVILYATHINNKGFQRFSVAHELGHYFLEGHYEAVIVNGHESIANTNSNLWYEQEADAFASGLLMPKHLFDNEARNVGEGMVAIKSLAKTFGTSTLATASKYVKRSREYCALVVSSRNHVNYSILSDSLKNYPSVEWIKKNTPLPDTLTKNFNSNNSNISMAKEQTEEVDCSDWFGEEVEGTLIEEVLGLGSYNKSLTVLTAIDLPDPEEVDDESELVASWTPKF